jgi:hypothetical protein
MRMRVLGGVDRNDRDGALVEIRNTGGMPACSSDFSGIVGPVDPLLEAVACP